MENGLLIHGRLAPPDVQPLHRHIVECVGQMKKNLRAPPPLESIIKYIYIIKIL